MKKPIILLLAGLLLLFTSCIRDEKVELDPESTTISIEKEVDHAIAPEGQIQVNATYIEANNKFEEAVFEWVTENQSIATVDSKGLVTAKKAGFTTVLAKAYGFSSEKLMIQVVEDTTDVFVAEVIPEKDAILITETTTLSARSENVNGTVTSSTEVTWISLTPDIATIDNTGLITPITSGDAQFQATVDGIETPIITISIGDDADAVATVKISGSNPTLMENETASLTAEIKTFNGNTLTDGIVVWSSSDESLATVSTNGLVTAHLEGNVTITATFDGLSDSYDIMIMNASSQFRSGTFMTIDYVTEGTFMLELTSDNELKLNFIDFNSPDVNRLPGVVAYLSNTLSDARDAKASGLRIGAVPQTSGNFTMDIDGSLDPASDFTKFSNVFIICEPFTIPYGGGAIVD